MNQHPRILIGIASYRDPELPKTIASALQNAKHKDRLVFAVVNQCDPSTQHSLDALSIPHLKLAQFDYRLSAGVGFARRLMTDFWVDEDFALQIDAHTRFQQGWDEILLQEWQACQDPCAVLSAYPTPFKYDANGQESFTPYSKVCIVNVEKFNQYIPIFKGALKHEPTAQRRPILGTSAGFIFGPGAIFGVPYIKEICFMGEEFARAFQLFSHGFNLYAPNVLPLYHLYYRPGSRFWHDMPQNGDQARYNHLTKQSYDFLRQLLKGELANYPAYFGSTRTLADYETYLGQSILLSSESPGP
ncbi:UDP-N-acetylglucosamine-transferase [Candidatus Saccharibacteria bacterium]|nr:UDP-N-acetylglucosamine-transferase [Candidatus Saccharibacteria bacterium]